MKPLKISGYIKDGQLKFSAEKYAIKQIAELKDGYCEIEIRSGIKRSNQANRYLHGVLIPEFRRAMVQSGYNEIRNDDIAKDVMKMMFLKRDIVNEKTGEVLEIIRNTSDLSSAEISQLFDDVIMFCADSLHYVIPYPNERLMLNFQDGESN